MLSQLRSPQVVASLKRGLWLLVWAAIPIVLDLLVGLANETTGTMSLVFVLLGRLVEGYRDSIRNKKFEIQDSDVGASLARDMIKAEKPIVLNGEHV